MKRTSMKRKSLLVLMGMCLALLLAGCGSYTAQPAMQMSIGGDNENPNVTVVTIKNALDDSVISANRNVHQDKPLVMTADIEGDGSIEVQMVAVDEATLRESASMTKMADPELAAFDHEFTGNESLEVPLPIGSYYINAVGTEGTTGTVSIEFPEEVRWTSASSSEEAAQLAGLDGFATPAGVTLSSGVVPANSPYADYSYMQGLGFVQGHYLLGNGDELNICKAGAGKNADIFGNDKNNDYLNDEFFRDYPYEWTRTIGDIEVKCYGNTENKASKAVWSIGESNYALVVWDWNHGTASLTDGDVDALVNAIR